MLANLTKGKKTLPGSEMAPLVFSRLQCPVELRPVHVTSPESIPDLIAVVELSCVRTVLREVDMHDVRSCVKTFRRGGMTRRGCDGI